MRTTTALTRGNLASRVLLTLALLVAGTLGTVGTLWATGKIELPFLSRKPPQGPPPGTVPVPLTARALPAYTRLTRDHFWDTKRGTFSVVYLRPEEIGPTVITTIGPLLGRVLAYDKAAGYAITEGELLPRGTRAGLVGGIPPGKVALVLEAERVRGIHGLHTGDHLNLLASVPLDSKASTRSGGLVGGSLVVSGVDPEPPPVKRAKVQVLAQDAVLVSAVTIRNAPVTSSSLTQGMRVTTKPVQEVVIAVAPEESTRITEALATDATITAVARSGRPEGAKEASWTPPPEEPRLTVVEAIRGSKRTTVIFATPPEPPPAPPPRPKKQPEVRPASPGLSARRP
jgi:hypothetical protein